MKKTYPGSCLLVFEIYFFYSYGRNVCVCENQWHSFVPALAWGPSRSPRTGSVYCTQKKAITMLMCRSRRGDPTCAWKQHVKGLMERVESLWVNCQTASWELLVSNTHGGTGRDAHKGAVWTLPRNKIVPHSVSTVSEIDA